MFYFFKRCNKIYFTFSGDTKPNDDSSYTVGLIDKLNKPPTLGTSWNVFGVPGNNIKTSNPYGKMSGNPSRR